MIGSVQLFRAVKCKQAVNLCLTTTHIPEPLNNAVAGPVYAPYGHCLSPGHFFLCAKIILIIKQLPQLGFFNTMVRATAITLQRYVLVAIMVVAVGRQGPKLPNWSLEQLTGVAS